MRTYAHFDSKGAIQSLIVVDTSEGVDAGLVPRSAILVDEVEGVELNIDDLDIEAVSQFVRNYKVSPASSSPRRLVKK
jgi:hypothetical protein